MKRLLLALAVTLVAAATGASAQDGPILGQRPTDRLFTAEGLAAALADREVRFYDGSAAVYRAGGAYSYTYSDGDPPFRGEWQVRNRGQVCVTFDNGFVRCDTYVRSAEQFVLIIASGERFPVRSILRAN